MILITIFVELRVVAGRSRTRAGSPRAVSRRPCCAVTLRRTAWSERGMGAALAWHGKCVSDKAPWITTYFVAVYDRKEVKGPRVGLRRKHEDNIKVYLCRKWMWTEYDWGKCPVVGYYEQTKYTVASLGVLAPGATVNNCCLLEKLWTLLIIYCILFVLVEYFKSCRRCKMNFLHLKCSFSVHFLASCAPGGRTTSSSLPTRPNNFVFCNTQGTFWLLSNC
jgi:hypothetical protein